MQPFASVAVIVKLNAPLWVGVPINAPPDESVKPAGNAPVVTAKVYGAVPPEPATDWLYPVPTVPPGKFDGFRVIGGQSSLVMVPEAVLSAMVALLGLLRLMPNVSLGSNMVSPLTSTVMVCVA